MKAILIDPFEKSIKYVEINNANDVKGLNTMYELIGCNCFDTFRPGELDIMLVDDHGHLKETEEAFFLWKGYNWPLAGKALLFGMDDPHGDLDDVRMTIEQVRTKITWLGTRPARH